jgi:hypothetical protein
MEIWWQGPDGSVQDAYWYDGQQQWGQFTLAPAGSSNGPITAVSRASNTMEIWWVGPDGSVQDRYWYDGATQWQPFTLAPPNSAFTSAGIASLSRASGTMEVWWVGPDGSVQDANFYAAPPASIGPINASYTFDSGVAAGGGSDFTVWPDGSYVFEGHLHDSGAASYNDNVVCVIKDNLTDTAHVLSGHSGHMAGTFESGSRDDNWNISSRKADLQSDWNNFNSGWQWDCEADVNSDLNSITDKAIAAVGLVISIK